MASQSMASSSLVVAKWHPRLVKSIPSWGQIGAPSGRLYLGLPILSCVWKAACVPSKLHAFRAPLGISMFTVSGSRILSGAIPGLLHRKPYVANTSVNVSKFLCQEESDLEGDNSKDCKDLDALEAAAQKQGYNLQRLRELEQRAAQVELKPRARASVKKTSAPTVDKKGVSPGSSSIEDKLGKKRDVKRRSINKEAFTNVIELKDSEKSKEDTRVDGQPHGEQDAERRNYLLHVQAIRNRVPKNGYKGHDNWASNDEIKVFEEWAVMKVRDEGPSVAPVIEDMRRSLLQKAKERSQAQVAGVVSVEEGKSLIGQTELPGTRSRSFKLPTEKDPLAGVTVRPVVLKSRSKVPEHWDVPGGTVVLIDKPKGWSSFAVCDKLRQILRVKKVGHAGTLDPLSTGLLIICVGKATKLADSFQAMTKVYSGTMRFGESTPSLDAGTLVSERSPWEHIQDVDVQRAVDSFIGDIMQVPPMYSAIKVKGERLYSKARRGEEIQVPARPVTVYDFQLKRSLQNRQDWDFLIICSKGTYIRTLCADLAQSLKSCAYLTALRREKIGNLSVKDAWLFDELQTQYKETSRVIYPTEQIL